MATLEVSLFEEPLVFVEETSSEPSGGVTFSGLLRSRKAARRDRWSPATARWNAVVLAVLVGIRLGERPECLVGGAAPSEVACDRYRIARAGGSVRSAELRPPRVGGTTGSPSSRPRSRRIQTRVPTLPTPTTLRAA